MQKTQDGHWYCWVSVIESFRCLTMNVCYCQRAQVFIMIATQKKIHNKHHNENYCGSLVYSSDDSKKDINISRSQDIMIKH